MEYSIQKLAQLAGVSTRTLRYYDEIGLLKPCRTTSGYRIYGSDEVDMLQQILFYRALNFPLDEIRCIVQASDFSRREALRRHLSILRARQERIRLLIHTVLQTMDSLEGGHPMNDEQKFEAFKTDFMTRNEQKHGVELRSKYGEKRIDEANAKMLSLSQQDYDRFETLQTEIQNALTHAVRSHASPDSDIGRNIAAMHKEWLCYTWPKYTAKAHIGLAKTYIEDPRFTEYYDKEQPGCAKFLYTAISTWIHV